MNVSYETFEKNSLELGNLDIAEKLKAFNKTYESSVKANDGLYGNKTIDRGNGLIIDVTRNEQGQISKDYYQDGKLIQNRLKLSDGLWERTRFDDDGNPYVKETIKFGKDSPKEFFYQLAADARIVKGNFVALTDSLGRPVLNEVKDVQLREGERQNLNVRRTSEYRWYDERGHLIADSFGGPASAENVVAQIKEVNHGKFIEVEEKVRQLKRDNPNSKIDYSIKTNYADQSTRPSSFEPKIIMDGKEIKLPKELSKIFNDIDMSKADMARTAAKEKIERIRPMNDNGKEMGESAALVTFAISTVDNVSQFASGEITAEEMAVDIAKETAAAGALGYGTGFISNAVSTQMLRSGCEMIRQLGSSSVPAAAVSFGVTSFETVNDFAKSEIDLKELTYNLGENGVGVAGGFEGAKYGAIAGTAVAGPTGGVVGGFVGGMVGYAVTTEAYATVIEYGGEGTSLLASKAQNFATKTYETAKEIVPEKAESIKSSMLDYASKVNLPISF